MKHFHCPVNGWDCPYYVDTAILDGQEEHCLCGMGLPTAITNLDPEVEQLNPYEECDDFFCMYGDGCDPEEYTDETEE